MHRVTGRQWPWTPHEFEELLGQDFCCENIHPDLGWMGCSSIACTVRAEDAVACDGPGGVEIEDLTWNE